MKETERNELNEMLSELDNLNVEKDSLCAKCEKAHMEYEKTLHDFIYGLTNYEFELRVRNIDDTIRDYTDKRSSWDTDYSDNICIELKSPKNKNDEARVELYLYKNTFIFNLGASGNAVVGGSDTMIYHIIIALEEHMDELLSIVNSFDRTVYIARNSIYGKVSRLESDIRELKNSIVDSEILDTLHIGTVYHVDTNRWDKKYTEYFRIDKIANSTITIHEMVRGSACNDDEYYVTVYDTEWTRNHKVDRTDLVSFLKNRNGATVTIDENHRPTDTPIEYTRFDA